MRGLRKYLAILFLMTLFPLVHFVASHFIIAASDDIYNHVPQESDLVIEINTRNFINEVAYQKLFNEEYFNRKIFPPTDKEERPAEFNVGIDFFSKSVLFREVWSNEIIWVGVVKYTDKKKLQEFIDRDFGDSKIFYGKEYAVIQLRPSANQERLDEHMNEIAQCKIKSFTERVQLKEVFDPEKELNVYFFHESIHSDAKLIDGYLNIDFVGPEITIGGEFIPTADIENSPSIAYEVNEDVAFSMRSSLNLFNSLFWFSREKFDSIPKYHQMAFDYDGVHIFLCDKNLEYQYPMKSFPELQMQFELDDVEPWDAWLYRLERRGAITVDSTSHMISTSMGTFFQFEKSPTMFKLKRGDKAFTPKSESDIYFDMRVQVDALMDRCKFAIDEKNPPPEIEQMLGLGIASEMVAEMKSVATMESFRFNLKLNEESKVIAEGHGVMKEKEGHSIIESMQFAVNALLFLKNYM